MNSKILTESEAFDRYLKEGYDDCMAFQEYIDFLIRFGYKIIK